MKKKRRGAIGTASNRSNITGMDTQNRNMARDDDTDANLRAPSYYVLQATHDCAGCGKSTSVFALAVPPDHLSTDGDIELDDDGDSMGLAPDAFREWLFSPAQWQEIAGPALLSQIGILSASVASTLGHLAPTLRQNPDRNGEWTNFCAHCDRAVWEGVLYPNPGQPFCPKDDAAAARIMVHEVHEPFAAFTAMCWTDRYRNKWPLFKRLGVACSEAD
ncbi:hypothetical protein LMG3431_02463 [Achromobacter pestifer]|uniref:Uncharacterized protein n=2 Tax=Achromobacter pestifer TaxID=1353889 RepID=A0A6S6YXF7_9BURK|nr:hypothetical protein LMG3431_02463 [Achromobacter pestifer]